jgi:hypothetical protein
MTSEYMRVSVEYRMAYGDRAVTTSAQRAPAVPARRRPAT